MRDGESVGRAEGARIVQLLDGDGTEAGLPLVSGRLAPQLLLLLLQPRRFNSVSHCGNIVFFDFFCLLPGFAAVDGE